PPLPDGGLPTATSRLIPVRTAIRQLGTVVFPMSGSAQTRLSGVLDEAGRRGLPGGDGALAGPDPQPVDAGQRDLRGERLRRGEADAHAVPDDGDGDDVDGEAVARAARPRRPGPPRRDPPPLHRPRGA